MGTDRRRRDLPMCVATMICNFTMTNNAVEVGDSTIFTTQAGRKIKFLVYEINKPSHIWPTQLNIWMLIGASLMVKRKHTWYNWQCIWVCDSILVSLN